ncbi:SHOCT domain-containing protein [Curtobacterium oceanosedimentum]|uniref:SHOCT domain-containing protein n=1 Tax=Curtobacterium oceanosedimentum TaxID=465820 RepID=UPI001CE088C6|nr:SHOCT domain-containing protein [Curtobacterium oceanosedimentum]MCA5923210.1 SHOCT domain-containing protein [Curtobacterium oceanosedimentum]
MVLGGLAFGEIEGPEGSGASDLFSGWFGVAFGVVAALMLLTTLTIVLVTLYRGKRMADRGQNPLTVQEDLAHRAMQSRTLAPDTPLEQRLAELDDLHARGVISDEEHRRARAEALRGR